MVATKLCLRAAFACLITVAMANLGHADPQSAQAHIDAGVSLIEQGNDPGAEREFRAAIAAEFGLAKGHYNLGVVLFRQKRYEASRASLLTALKIQPDHVKAHYFLGRALEALEFYELAAVELQTALSLEPSMDVARRALADVQQAADRRGGKSGDDAGIEVPIATLIARLKSTDVGDRVHAAHALGERRQGAEAAVTALAGALKDAELAVRLEAATALGNIGPPAAAALPALREALSENDRETRARAELAISKLDTTPDGAELRAALTRKAKDAELVKQAVEKLGVAKAGITEAFEQHVAFDRGFAMIRDTVRPRLQEAKELHDAVSDASRDDHYREGQASLEDFVSTVDEIIGLGEDGMRGATSMFVYRKFTERHSIPRGRLEEMPILLFPKGETYDPERDAAYRKRHGLPEAQPTEE